MNIDNMKSFFALLSIILLYNCSTHDDAPTTPTALPSPATFAIYDHVTEALSNHSVYSIEAGTLLKRYEGGEVVHVQVSPLIANQLSSEIEKLVMMTFVEATCKAFAHTTEEDIQITTVPLDAASVPPTFNYLQSFSVSAIVNRKTVFKVLEKHVLVRDLKQLYNYDEDNELWYTNDKFELLQSVFLDDVFAELVK